MKLVACSMLVFKTVGFITKYSEAEDTAPVPSIDLYTLPTQARSPNYHVHIRQEAFDSRFIHTYIHTYMHAQ